MSQPAPNRNIWQILLFAMVVFLGMQMLFQKPQTDPRTADQIMTQIRQDAEKVKNIAAQQGSSIHDVLMQLDQQKELDLQLPFDKLSAAQDHEQLLLLNGLVCDQSSAKVLPMYERQIDAMTTLSKEQKEDSKLLEEMLVANTQMRAADQRNDIQRITFASDTVIRLERSSKDKPVWHAIVNLSPAPGYDQTSLTAAQISEQVHTVAERLGKETLVWGFFPGYQVVDFLVHLTGAVPAFSYWFGALMLAILVRLIIWPLSQKQMMWSRQMSQLTPLINEIKEQYKGKTKPEQQQEMQKRIMGLYQEYGMNPFQGCMPALLQLPLFLLVYQSMLHYRFDFQNGTFAWINPATSAATHGFIAQNLGQKDYILIVLYGISMVVAALLAPVSDPTNYRQQKIMGVSMAGLFGVMMFFWPVPSAFILYWTFTNMLATAQSLRAYRLPLPPLVKKNAPNGGVFPTTGRPGVSKEGLPSSVTTNGKLNGKPKSTGAPKIHKPKKKK